MPAGKFDQHRELLAGFVRVHILQHAAEEELYGQQLIDELGRHGYRLSPGTLYPILHAMERSGYLQSRRERHGRTERRLYRATPKGRRALGLVRQYLAGLGLHAEAGGPGRDGARTS
ncbi:MAG TPA: PadR family transcriptional regulator [Woeseiaceae bacterium]|nr:PadR family transcriptional regulator [Woeseiaceae bacterium]